MADATQIMFSHRDLVAAMLKDQGIHEGRWALSVEFGLGVGLSGPTPESVVPTGMVSVVRVGIAQSQEQNAITFDAAELNPRETKPVPARKAPKKKAA